MLIQVSHQVMSPELIQLIDAMVQALRMGLWMIYQYIWRWCYGLYEIICIHMHIFFINIYIYMHMMIYHVYTYNCVEYNLEQITSRNRCLPFLTDATPKPSNGLFHRFSDGHCPIMVLIVVAESPPFFLTATQQPRQLDANNRLSLGEACFNGEAAAPGRRPQNPWLHHPTVPTSTESPNPWVLKRDRCFFHLKSNNPTYKYAKLERISSLRNYIPI